LKSKNKFALGIPLLLIIGAVGYLCLPWLLIYIGVESGPNPLPPDITYGEFPFRLEYELNGERKVIEDTVICEYDGIDSDEAKGKFRKWKARLANRGIEGDVRLILLEVDDIKQILYYPGSADFYMGDPYTHYENNFSFPDAVIAEKDSSSRLIFANELLQKYHIKLISWDYSKPITNSFSSNKK
jgi:hypothetical protein